MKRPKIISFICIVGYISVLLAFPQIFSPQIKKLGALIPALFGMLVAANFIACVGIWYYKQWGVQLYLLSFFGKLVFNLSFDDYGGVFYANAILTVFFIVVLLRFYPKMNPNL